MSEIPCFEVFFGGAPPKFKGVKCHPQNLSHGLIRLCGGLSDAPQVSRRVLRGLSEGPAGLCGGPRDSSRFFGGLCL